MDGNSTFIGASARGPGSAPDGHAHGRAALLLVESLMHSLLAKGTISRDDFVEIVDGAAEVELELTASDSSYPTHIRGSLLLPLAAAFKKELGS